MIGLPRRFHFQQRSTFHMATFNQVQFIGRLGKDPDLQVMADGKPVAKFSLAVDQGKDAQGRDKDPMWLNVVAWERLAEIVEKYALKGMQVFVQGKLVIRSYEDKQGVKRQAVDIVASVLQILDKKPTGNGNGAPVDPTDDPFLPEEYK
jgi:single-strand DNA-binding protein